MTFATVDLALASDTDMVFQTTTRRGLTLQPISSEMAEYFGCPGATHTLTASLFKHLGTVRAVTGKPVRVPGWPTRKGFRVVFTPWVLDPETGTDTVTGWIGQ